MGSMIFDFMIPFILILGVLVFIHELGHHLTAKMFGMKVDAFSLGFPPRAWGFRWGSGKLRDKFKRDVASGILTNDAFQVAHDLLKSAGVSENTETSVALLSELVEIERTEIKRESTNKKGKKEEFVETHTDIKLKNNEAYQKLKENERDAILRAFNENDALTELFYDRREILDDTAYKKKYETDYCLSWVPLGGYCKINGMIDESLDVETFKESAPKPWEYRAKPIWQRMIVISAGVIFNTLLAVVIFAGVAFFKGVPDVEKFDEIKNNLGTEISAVSPGSPAELAGMQSGDKIESVDGKNVDKWFEVVEIIRKSPNKKIEVSWRRKHEKLSAVIKPNSVRIPAEDREDEVGQIGISAPSFPDFTKSVSLFGALGYGVQYTQYMVSFTLTSIKNIIVGKQSMKEAMGGPIAIVRMTGEVKQQRGYEGLIGFMALLSISLAVFNLFPIPALDGGHLVLLFFEAIIRRPLSVKFKIYAQQAGMALLLMFIAYVIYNDILRWSSAM